MVAILLAGAVAYRQLPVSALPQVDYPTIQVRTFYPGASPDVMASSVTAPLERQFGQMPGLTQMTSTSSSGSSMITLLFSLDSKPRCRGAGGPGGHKRRLHLPAPRPADPAGIQQGEPRRRADHDPGPDLENPAPAAGGGPCGYAVRAEDIAASGRGARQHQRRAEARGPGPREPDGPGRLRPDP